VDQIKSGRRQEGIYAGFEVFARKISTKVVLAGVGPILAFSGYVKNAQAQPYEALLAIRLLLAVVPAVILFLAVVLAWKYPLSRQAHRDVQVQLEERGLIARESPGKSDN
jgi:GPH family glycoside/pentoside/hexuronide:cation symporter